MVQLEEVEDEELDAPQVGEQAFNDDDDFTDTDSEISSDDDLNPTHSESLTDRISALRDILPPSTRQRIATTFTTTKSYVIGGLYLTGKAGWILCTSAMLIGVPFGLAWMEEQQVVEMEKEQKMREMGNELLTPGAATVAPQQQGRPAL